MSTVSGPNAPAPDTDTVSDPQDRDAPPPPLTRRRRLGLSAIRIALAALAGAATYASFPPLGWWFTAPLGIALLVVALLPWDIGRRPDPRSTYERHTQHTPGPLAAFGLAALVGFVFFLLLVNWVGMYVGAIASFGLAVVESLYLGLFGVGASYMLRALHRSRLRVPGYVLTTICVAAWWSAVEWLRSSWPWNGFPWGRLAFGQADGPLLHLASVTTTAGLGFVVALVGVAAAMFVAAWQWRHVPLTAALRAPAWLAAYLVVLLGAAAALAASPAGQGQRTPDGPDTLDVAAIQGNVPRLGLDFSAQRRAVLDNHVRESLRYADSVSRGQAPQPDLVVWPENAADVSPLADSAARAEVDRATAALDAPTLVGTVINVGTPAEPATLNTMLVWENGQGHVDRHDKYFVQPFGEWLPWRSFWERFFPVAKTAGHFVPGPREWTVQAGETTVGVATCFEIAFTDAARGAVEDGARILTVPTNNATFGYSDMTYQQLAMSRVQAVEHHIPVVVAATSGVSATIDADGRVLSQSNIFEPAVLTAEFGPDKTGTLATRLGTSVEYALVGIGLIGALGAALVLRRMPRLSDRHRPDIRSNQEDEA